MSAYETFRGVDDVPSEGGAAAPSWKLEQLHSARRDARRFEMRADQSQGLTRLWFSLWAACLRWLDCS